MVARPPVDRWLLLRGLGREQAHWFDFPTRLARDSASEVHCLDLPGAGSEWQRTAPWRIGAYAEDILRRVRHLDRERPGRWWVFGISLGGMVTLELAQRFGEGLAAVVIANSSVGDCPLHQRLSPRAAASVARALLETRLEARERAIYRLTSGLSDTALNAPVAQAVAAHRERPVTRRTILAQLWAASRFRLPSNLPVPLLVLSSAGDRLAHPDCSARIARHFGAPLHVHPTAGHDLPLDAPEWLSTALSRFQRELLPDGGDRSLAT